MHRRLVVCVALVSLALSTAHAEEGMSVEDALVLHAEALLAESQGDIDTALANLRRAAIAAPDEELIAFDLARLSQAQNGPESDRDALVRLEPEGADARLLRAYVLTARGQKEEAITQVATLLRDTPENDEARTLLRLLAPAGVEHRTFGARVRLATQYDDNVAVLPEDVPSQLRGASVLLQADVRYAPTREFALSLGLDVTPYLDGVAGTSSRRELGLYDTGAVSLGAAYARRLGPIAFAAALSLSDVLNDTFQKEFMRSASLRLEGALADLVVPVGVFVEAGYRDFRNPTPPEDDRDGPLVRGGLNGRVGTQRFSVLAQLGFQSEFARGEAQRETGPFASLGGRLHFEPVSLGAFVAAERRDHQTARLDHRLSASASASVEVAPHTAIVASYTFVRNDAPNRFDYTRNLAQLGVEGRW